MKRLALSLRPDHSELDRARAAIRTFCEGVLNSVHCNRVVLAIDEALTNIVEHAGHTDEDIQFSMECTDQELRFVLEDRGQRFDPHAVEQPDLARHVVEGREGGLGVFLYTTIMTAQRDDRPGGGNRLTLRYGLAPETRP